jgi:hypothetical protein
MGVVSLTNVTPIGMLSADSTRKWVELENAATFYLQGALSGSA